MNISNMKKVNICLQINQILFKKLSNFIYIYYFVEILFIYYFDLLFNINNLEFK